MDKKIAAFLLVFWSVTAQADEVVIAAFGDSLTQGYGLPLEQGFVPQLEKWLTDNASPARVINAGVSGDTTAGGLSRIGWTLTPDVDAIIVALGGNDLLRGLPPEQSRANLEGIVSEATNAGVEVLLIGLQAPGNYGPEFKSAFDAMYPEIAEAYGTLYLDSFFAGWDTPDGEFASMVHLMQGDGIHPNAEGVSRIVEGIGPVVQELIMQLE